MDLETYFDALDGVATAEDIAKFYGVDRELVADWADDVGVPVINAAYVFSYERADEFGDWLEDDDEDEGEDDEDDDDWDDEVE